MTLAVQGGTTAPATTLPQGGTANSGTTTSLPTQGGTGAQVTIPNSSALGGTATGTSMTLEPQGGSGIGGSGSTIRLGKQQGASCTSGPGSPVAELIAGEQHTCVRLTDGHVKCWGSNEYGELGDGKGGITGTFSITPVTVAGIKAQRTAPASVVGIEQSAVAIAGTGDHTCVILTDGSVWCMGENTSGQLGYGEPPDIAVPVPAHAPMTAMGIALGGQFTCALLNPQSVQCWGTGRAGALGNGDVTGSLTPVDVALPDGVVIKSIVGKYYHTCALSTEGRLWCWGAGDSGQLGDSRRIDSSTPVEVTEVCAP